MVEGHLFLADAYGRDACDRKVDDGDRARTCGQPRHAHEPLVSVHLACRDERGNFDHSLALVEIFLEPRGDIDLRLEGDPLEPDPMEWGEGKITIFGQQFETHGRADHVGNLCWDATQMRLSEVKRLVKLLVENGWVRTEWANEGPFVEMFPEASGG